MSTKRSPDRITLRDVAREAGVSVATASRALNGGDRAVGVEVQTAVEAAAERLRYAPDLSARAMKKGQSSSIGLLVSDIGDPYFAAIASGVINAAKRERLTVTVASSDRSPAHEFELVGELSRQGHRSIVLAGSRRTSADSDELVDQLQRFERGGGSVVSVSQPVLPFATISVDNSGGARSLALQLAGHGYRRFAIVAGSREIRSVNDRIEGFRAGLAEMGLAVRDDLIVEDQFSRDGGYHAAHALMQRDDLDIDLLFAVSDVMALGALVALREAGKQIGIDIGVAGFDDILLAKDVSPGLSTVAVPLAQMGTEAVRLALAGAGAGESFELPSSVVLRDSTPRRR